MRKIWIPLLFSVLGLSVTAQDSESILMSIGEQQITKGEFEYIFNKNNSATQDEPTSLKEYVDMFTKFKLKVIEAENRGMDTTQAFKTELLGYREQLAKPYLIDQKLSDEILEEAYYRLANEINASHILLRLEQHPRPADTLKVYNKALEIRKRAMNGEDFATLASRYSEDPSAKQNGGNLNYFAGFMMVFPFEDGAYKTPIGEVSMPIRTRFGYHLVKTNDIRPSRGEVKVAHILFLENEEMTPEQKAELKTKADAAYKKVIKNPDSFGEVAKEESDDHASAESGGEMGWFATGQMVYEFQEKSFELEVGEISKPFRTRFGWHIVKKLDARPYPSYEDKKDEIKKMLARTERGRQPEESFFNKLEAEYGYQKHEENVMEFVGLSEKYRYKDSAFMAVTRGMEKPVITLDSVDVTFTQEHFADYLISDPRGEVPDETERVNRKWERYYRKTLKDFENTQLERKYPEFRYLMQEYHDGILLFDISQEEIWNKASIDTAGLEKFYHKVKKKYPWETEHYVGKLYYCADDSIQGLLLNMLNDKKSDSVILATLNKTAPNVDIEEGIYKPGQEAAVDSVVFAGVDDIGKYYNFTRGHATGKKYKIGAPKELQFVRGAVISEYQDYLEEQWIKSLRKKYKTKVDKKVLKTVEIEGEKK